MNYEPFAQAIDRYPEKYERGPDHLVPLEVLTERLETCDGCHSLSKSGRCGAGMLYKSLTRQAELPCGRCPREKWPEPTDSRCGPPSIGRRVWNLAQSLAAFVADGLKTVSAEEYRQRLEICDSCDRRKGGQCLECGCQLSLKAKGRAFDCPLKKWPEVTQ